MIASPVAVPRLFPEVSDPEAFERIARNEAELGTGISAIADVLGLSGPLLRFAGGSLPVYAVGEKLVLKVYPPLYIDERDREATVLELLDGRLSIPTPGLRNKGELEGWGYLLMDRLRGEQLSEAWPCLGEDDRAKLATKLGEALSALHSIRVPALEPLTGDWRSFLEQQRQSAVSRQQSRGLESQWLEQIPEFLSKNPTSVGPAGCLLHTEVMREHLLVERGPEGWHFSGLFDFEPSMVGAREYEFASVGLFFSCGARPLLRRVLLAYGYEGNELNAALERRLLAYALLHKYSNLAWYLRRLPPPEGAASLDELAAHWWGVTPEHAR